MIRMGLEEVSAWNIYSRIYKPIIKLHAEKGACEFDDEIVSNYTNSLENRLVQKEISFNTYRNFMRGIERLTEMGKTGKLVWKGSKFTSKFKLNDYFENVLNLYLDSGDFSIKGRSDAMWIVPMQIYGSIWYEDTDVLFCICSKCETNCPVKRGSNSPINRRL